MKKTIERKVIALARQRADAAVKQTLNTLTSMYELRGGGEVTTPERAFEYLMTSSDAKTREFAMDTFMALMFHRGEHHALLNAENDKLSD